MDDNKVDSNIKELKEVFYDNLDNWPTESLKKTLFRLRPEESAEVYLNLHDEYHDLTGQSLEIEKKFRPKVTLRTRELKIELTRWDIGGGSFFRVIGDADTPDKASLLSLQYLVIWTRQLFPFQFGIFSVPFFLMTLFTWLFSSQYPAGQGTGFWTYLTYLLTSVVFICLGIWVVFEGFYKRTIKGLKNWKIVPDSMLGFVFPGILLWTTVLEYAITDLVSATGFIALIPISAWLSLLVGIVIIMIGGDFYIRGEKSYVERFSHPMDYAPLFIFLIRDEKNEWKIDGAQFDYFHYKTFFVPKEKLSFEKDDEVENNPSFLIDRSWHAFREYAKPNIMIRLFSNLIFIFIILAVTIAAYIIYFLVYFNYALPILAPIVVHPATYIVLFVVLPMILVLITWSRSRTREFTIPMWEELKDKDDKNLLLNHHLTFDRLRILWNLRNREHLGEQRITNLWSKSTWIEDDSSRFVSRVKMQYTFDRYKDWRTLRDTQEELLSLISKQTKEEELREIRKEIFRAKRELRRQFSSDKRPEKHEHHRFRKEQNDDINEEQDMIAKLDALEDKVEEALKKEQENTDEIVEEIDETEQEVDIPKIPEVPKLEEIKKEEEKPEDEDKKENGFKIPDIPIDVKKDED
ncbi:MAG: hypothetical protein JXA54_06670 [Candidatus Heimdallarchaeota archaeon]|nr:hypothetical protein [Candidatus Heimdallarchaeota archaeon]